MIFEFFGLPGSGKTTLCKSLCEEDDFSYLPNIGFFDKGKVIFTFFSVHFILYFFDSLVLYFLSENKNKKIFFLLISTYIKYQIISKYYSDRKYCVDHGIIQTISSMNFYKLTSEKIVFRIIRRMNKMKNVKTIYVYSNDLHRIYERIIEREESKRITSLSKEQAFSVLSIHLDLFDSIAQRLESLKKIHAFDDMSFSKKEVIEWSDHCA